MSTMSYLLFSGYIILGLISFINAVSLDGNCTMDSQCDPSSGLICRDKVCKCEAPWYQPCNTKCEIQKNRFQQGDECRSDDNCIANARCDSTSKQCVCKENFSVINKLCYKKLNEICENDIDCWSGQCDKSSRKCTCKAGYESLTDGGCKRKFVKFYSNWTQANETNAFCFNDLSCLNINAKCEVQGTYPGKFCQCLSPGYTADIDNQKCEIVLTEQLSPAYNTTICSYCKDDNAVCASVGNKRTCWCRAGYDKTGNKCVPKRTTIIFPSSTDFTFHSYDGVCNVTDGNIVSQGNLCTCAAFYEFDSTTRSCKKIERKWINDNFEYGICTRITSNDLVQTPNDALCPPPLRCLLNGDKYVCACGTDQIIEELSNGSRCVYRLGKNAANPSVPCPMNANRANNTCQCDRGFKQFNVDNRCELILQPNETLSGCNSNPSNEDNQPCVKSFEGAAVLCQSGECRCNPDLSFANGNKCYALLNVTQSLPFSCPPNSKQNISNFLCVCADGYRQPNGRKRCEPKSKLFESSDTTFLQRADDLNQDDCHNLFPGNLTTFYNTNNNTGCQCVATTFVSPDGNQCWPYLYTNLNEQVTNCLTPNSFSNASDADHQCVCNIGFRPTNSSKKDCAPITRQLNQVIDIFDTNHRINTSDCQAVFGLLSIANEIDGKCICRDDISFPNSDSSRCLAILNVNTTESSLANDFCPDHASIQSASPGICTCNPGFNPHPNNRICETPDIPLNGTKFKPQSTLNTCGNLADVHCLAKYGDGSFCENNQCWCDRSISFKTNDSRCERLSKYIFPGLHERNNFSCHIDKDCASESVDINTIKCDRINPTDEYKVCVCKPGWFLNLETRKCETRCLTNCTERPNSECMGYKCVCKDGFIEVNSSCIVNPNILELYKPCNFSYTPKNNEPVQCTSCNRGGCLGSYKDIGFHCEKYSFDTNYCVPGLIDFCMSLIDYSQCDEETNKCVCSDGYYREEDTCVLPVYSRCKTDEECGSNKQCVGQQCKCTDGKIMKDVQDDFGRLVYRCVNGVDQKQINLFLILCLMLARICFA